MRPGSKPMWWLAAALLKTLAGSENPDDGDVLKANAHLNAKEGFVDFLAAHSLPEDHKLLLLVDQFEELFRYKGSSEVGEAEQFVKLLLSVFEKQAGDVYVIITMRTDHLGDCTRFEGLAEAINKTFYLTPRLWGDERRRAVEKPVSLYGGEFEETLCDRILNDMGDNPDQLPLMQHVLMRMWRATESNRPAEGSLVLTQPLYDEFGPIDKVLNKQANEALSSLAEQHGPQAEYIVEMLFRELTVRQEGAEVQDVRRPTKLQVIAEIAGLKTDKEKEMLKSIVDVFRGPEMAFIRPFSPAKLKPETFLDITHEALIRQWSRLKEWVKIEHDSVGNLRDLVRQAERASEEPSGSYLDIDDAKKFRKWWDEQKPSVEWARRYEFSEQTFAESKDYLERSEVHLEEKRLAKIRIKEEEAKARERAIKEKAAAKLEKQARLTKFVALAAIGTVVLVVLIGSWVTSERQKQLSEKVQRQSTVLAVLEAAALVAESKSPQILSEYLREDGLIPTAVALQATQDGPEHAAPARNVQALLKSYLGLMTIPEKQPPAGKLISETMFANRDDDFFMDFAASPDGNTLGGVTAEGKVFLLKDTGELIQEWPMPGLDTEIASTTSEQLPNMLPINRAVFSADGKHLLTIGPDPVLRTWKVTDNELKPENRIVGKPVPLADDLREVRAAAFSATGDAVVVVIKEIAYTDQLLAFASHFRVKAFATSDPQDTMSVTLDTREFSRLESHPALEAMMPVNSQQGRDDGIAGGVKSASDVTAVAIGGPQNRFLSIAFDNDLAGVWDLKSWMHDLRRYTQSVDSMRTIQEWKQDLDSGDWNPRSMAIRRAELFHIVVLEFPKIMVFSPDGGWLAASSDTSAHVFHLPHRDHGPSVTNSAKPELLGVETVSATDPLTGAPEDSSTGLPEGKQGDRRLEPRIPTWSYYDHRTPINGLGFVGDDFLTSASQDGGLKLYRYRHGQSFRELMSTEGPLNHLQAFASNGRDLIFALDGEGSVRRWDIGDQTMESSVEIVEVISVPTVTAIAPNGKIIAVGFENGILKVYQPKRDKTSAKPGAPILVLGSDFHSTSAAITAITASDGGNYLGVGRADGSFMILARSATGEFALGEEESLNAIVKGRPASEPKTLAVSTLAMDKNGSLLVVGSSNGVIGVWDRSSNDWKQLPIAIPEEGASPIFCSAAFDTNGEVLVTGSTDGMVRVWDTANWKLQTEFQFKPESPIGSEGSSLNSQAPDLPGSVVQIRISPDASEIAAILTEEPVTNCRYREGEDGSRNAISGTLKLLERTAYKIAPIAKDLSTLPPGYFNGITNVAFLNSDADLMLSNAAGDIIVANRKIGRPLFELQSYQYLRELLDAGYYSPLGMEYECMADQHCWVSVHNQTTRKLLLFDFGKLPGVSSKHAADTQSR